VDKLPDPKSDQKRESVQTPQARVRDSLYKHYKARGRKKYNLWLVYSPKLNRDIIIDSDKQLIYWLHFLESDPTVESFLLHDKQNRADPDFFVTFRGGERRADFLQLPPESNLKPSVTYFDNKVWENRFIQEDELIKTSQQAQRWLKPIMFAAAIREQQLLPLHNTLIIAEHKYKSGILADLLAESSGHDSMKVLGMVMRHFTEGRILLELSNATFGNNTPWKISTGERHENSD